METYDDLGAEIRPLIDTNRIDLGAMAPLAAPLIMYVETSGFCNLIV